MKISVFEEGYTNLIPGDTLSDFNELCDILSQVTVGPKNGQYIVRGHCDGERCDANMKSSDIIVIDGDQLIDVGTSCSPPEPVHELLKSKNITHVIHSSYSQNIMNNIFKWRAYIPCSDLIDATALRLGVSEVVSLLHGAGIMVRNVKEDNVPSQPWFTPRCPEGFQDDFFCAWHEGNPWVLGKVEVKTTAGMGVVSGSNNGAGAGAGGCFSWEWVMSQFQAGTIHQGAKSACGWLIHTTDWADVQIKQFLTTHIKALCPDPVKVKRALETKEIDKLIQYCREKHGVIEHVADWKKDLLTGAELRDKEFPPVKWAVDGIIPEGLTILAGDPKAGKSLMAVDICSAIASGIEAFGNRKCVAGTCVYVSLEDPPRRVQARIKQQCDLWPNTFKLLSGGVPQLGPSFYGLLDEMALLWPDLRCIVIDTMQFVVPPKPNGVTDYDHYYGCLDPLHRWTLDNHVAIVLITHMTKSRQIEGENPFAGIIGSVAIQGTSDAMILLRKNHAKANIVDPELPDGFLTIQGREMGADHLALDFDSEALKWAIIREAVPADETTNANWLLICDTLKKKMKTPGEIIKETKINKSTVRSCLKRMIEAKLITREEGEYGLIGTNYSIENDGW